MTPSDFLSQTAPIEIHRCVSCFRGFPKSELMPFTGFYACPQCKPEVVAKIARGEPPGLLFMHGRKLVVRNNTRLPPRCVKCNAPTEGLGVHRRLSWYHPALLLLIPTIVIFVLVGLFLQREFHLWVGLCPTHFKRRKIILRVGWGAITLGIAGVVFGPVFASGGTCAILVMASLLGIFTGVVTNAVAGRVVEATRVSGDFVFVKGCHPDYLAELPVWPEG